MRNHCRARGILIGLLCGQTILIQTPKWSNYCTTEKKNIYVGREREILRKYVMWLWELARQNSVEQAGEQPDLMMLSELQLWEIQQDFFAAIWKHGFFFYIGLHQSLLWIEWGLPTFWREISSTQSLLMWRVMGSKKGYPTAISWLMFEQTIGSIVWPHKLTKRNIRVREKES